MILTYKSGTKGEVGQKAILVILPEEESQSAQSSSPLS